MIHKGNLEITKANETRYAELTVATGDLYVYEGAKLEALSKANELDFDNVRIALRIKRNKDLKSKKSVG